MFHLYSENNIKVIYMYMLNEVLLFCIKLFKFLFTEPKITAPVYFVGNFATIPNTEFW